MDINQTESWLSSPGRTLATGIALLVVCAVFAALWFTSEFFFARPLGLLSGSAGIYLVYGGVQGLKERSDG
jgi:hypothetical protein